MTDQPSQDQILQAKVMEHFDDTDVFLISGMIDRKMAAMLVHACPHHRKKHCAVILTTPGGDPDAAYSMARFLKRCYDGFTLYIYGPCKSAGTLFALGAKSIVMHDQGELGPLDVQIPLDDDLVRYKSGLDIFQSIDSIMIQTFKIFEYHFLQLINRSLGSITTKTAADIAQSIAVGLMSPITEQINPVSIGETQRAIQIALDYGTRLQADSEVVKKLISDYPSHGFVIDRDEAEGLFGNVRKPEAIETFFIMHIQRSLMQEGYTPLVYFPAEESVVFHIPLEEPSDETETEPEETNDNSTSETIKGTSGGSHQETNG